MFIGMPPWTKKMASAKALLETLLRGELTEAQAEQLYRLGTEAFILSLLAASNRIAELYAQGNRQPSSPTTPSGKAPIYTRFNTSQRRSKKPGGKEGHPGARRAAPVKID